jgi:hypothetical protein
MKKSNFISRLIFILGVASTNLSFGQLTTNANINSQSLSENAKRDLSKDLANRMAFENLKKLNLKLYKDFSRYFANASDIQTTVEKNNISVNCKIDGVKTLVNYNNNGRWTSTLRIMEADQLPVQLYTEVLDNYPGYKVSRGKEVIVGPRNAYLIDIENEKKFKTVRIIDGEFDIYQEFMKQRTK